MNKKYHGRLAFILVIVCACLPFESSSISCAAESWVDTRQVGPFVCHATFPLDEYAMLFAELPELQRELSRTLGLPPARVPISIFIFADEGEHREFLTKHYGHVPYRRALFVKEGGQAGVYAYRHAELDIDLRHESTHALLHSVLPTVPLWLDEGLAEYFEVPPARRAFDHPHFDSLRWNMRLGMVQSVERLEQRELLGDMSGYDYRYSWAWVHFMLHGPEPAHRVLVKYLASIERGGMARNSIDGVQQVTYVERADSVNERQSIAKLLADEVPSPTDRMVQHFKYWHQ